MKHKKNNFTLAVLVFILVSTILSLIQITFVQRPLLLAERFINGLGWLQILCVSSYGAFLAYKMYDVEYTAYFRKLSWLLFSIVFFAQLFLGLLVDVRFLMTGKLHLPIPMMVIAGPIYRAEIGFMPILFISTILLSGPAWCSQYCYFGAWDAWASSLKRPLSLSRKLSFFKWTIFIAVILFAITFRLLGVNYTISTIAALAFGFIGVVIILKFSVQKQSMIHCTYYCPLGSLVNILKHINPFRLSITNSCTLCMKCSYVCKYNALNAENIVQKKPAYTCTLCGDCISACNQQAIRYQFFKVNSNKARNIYLVLTISIHVIFLALARI